MEAPVVTYALPTFHFCVIFQSYRYFNYTRGFLFRLLPPLLLKLPRTKARRRWILVLGLHSGEGKQAIVLKEEGGRLLDKGGGGGEESEGVYVKGGVKVIK